jgi:hypothetical protein
VEINLTRGGTFATKVDYAVGTNAVAIAAGDLNGDGKADLASANVGTTVFQTAITEWNFCLKIDYTQEVSLEGSDRRPTQMVEPMVSKFYFCVFVTFGIYQ